MKKRILSFLLALMLAAGSFPAVEAHAEQIPETETATTPAPAAETEMSGNITWDLTDGVLTISGTGPMEDYTFVDEAPWMEYWREVKAIVVAEGVTTIGKEAFTKMHEVTSVSISSTVTSIGKSAFENCAGLTEITIPGNVREIGERAFYYCWRLQRVAIGEGAAVIGPYAFERNGALAELSIPKTVTEIGDGAFLKCTMLDKVSLPSGLVKLGQLAFSNTAISSIRIPDGLTVLQHATFECTKLTEVTLPEGLTKIGTYAFRECTELTKVTMGDKVETIDERAFLGCTKLTQLNMPKSLKTLGSYALSGTALTEVEIPKGLEAIGYGVFSSCTELRKVILPEGLRGLGSYVFWNCSQLSEIALPSTLEAIGNHAFSGCQALTELTIPNSVVELGSYAFENCVGLKHVRLSNHMTKISQALFWGCANLTSVTVPRRITKVESQAFFNCTSLKDITLPGVVSIGERAFQYCAATSIHLGKQLEGVSDSAFYYCPTLTDVYYEGSEAQWNEVKISFSNEPLLNATYHYNVPIPAEDYYTLSLSTDEREFSVKMPKVLELDVSLARNGEPLSDWRFPSISWAGGKELANVQWEKRDNVWRLTLIPVLLGDDTATMMDPLSGETLQFKLSVTSNRLYSYLDNEDIRINGSGNGYAYFKGEPNQTYWFYRDGVKDFAYSDDQGIMEILLGGFETPGTYTIPLEFYQVNEQPMKSNRKYEAVVTVTPLEFTQQWEFSLEKGIGAAVGGLKLKLGDFEAKAALGQFSMNAGHSTALSMTRTWSDGKQELELTSTHGVKAGAGLESGITGKYKELDVDLASVSAGAEATGTLIYGIRIRDFAIDNLDQQRAVATFMIGEALHNSPNNYFLESIYEKLTKDAYNHSSIDVIDGTGVAAAGVFDAGMNALQVNDVAVFSELSASSEGSISLSQKTYDNGDAVYSTQFTSESNLSALSGATSQGVLNMDYLGKDITVEVQKTDQGTTLQTTSLSAQAGTITSPSLGKEYTNDYQRYLFAGASLSELRWSSQNVGDYLDGKRIAVSNRDVKEIAEFLSAGEEPVAYSDLRKTQMIHALPLSFGLEMLVGAEIDTTLSYVQTVEHATATGYAIDDQILRSGRMYGIDDTVKANIVNLDRLISDAMDSLTYKIGEFCHKVSDTVQNGVRSAKAWIHRKQDSLHQWTLSIISPKGEEDDSWRSSAEVHITNGGRSAVSGMTAVTVGCPYLIQVTETETGALVENLQAEPLTLTIAYTQQELQAAGYTPDTLPQDALAIFCYDSANDVFVYTDCSHDPETMTVTATIYTGGQYVLAVCDPEREPGLPPAEESFQWEGASVSLGDNLNLNFFLTPKKLEETAYAVITRSYADGREDHVLTVPATSWKELDGMAYITYTNLAAKEMGDSVTVVIYDGQGNALGEPHTDSIRGYAMRQLAATEDPELRTLLVDMLNYGAEAQRYFAYDAERPVNGELSEEQRGYATAAVETKSSLKEGSGRVGTALTLKNKIRLDFFFSSSALGENLEELYAVATYNDHYKAYLKTIVEGKDFHIAEDGSVYVSISTLGIADYGQMVTCTVYDAQDNALAWATDSIEGYAHRMQESIPAIVEAIVKFGASSYNYFH